MDPLPCLAPRGRLKLLPLGITRSPSSQIDIHPLAERVCLRFLDVDCDYTIGSVWLSRATSPALRRPSGSYSLRDGTVISPALRKPKKAIQKAAYSMILLWDWLSFPRMTGVSSFNKDGVIGRQVQGRVVCFLAWHNFTPLKVYFKSGSDMVNGSPMLPTICMQRIADK